MNKINWLKICLVVELIYRLNHDSNYNSLKNLLIFNIVMQLRSLVIFQTTLQVRFYFRFNMLFEKH